MENNKIWFIGNKMYTGDEAENRLDQTLEELSNTRSYLLDKMDTINSILKENNSNQNEDFSTKFNHFINLSENLSYTTILLEDISDYLHNHGF